MCNVSEVYQECVMSAAMMSGVCVPSACCCDRRVCSIWCCMGHWRRFSKLQNDIYSIVLAPQVTVKIQALELSTCSYI